MSQRGEHVVEFMGYSKLLSPAPRPGQRGGVGLMWFENRESRSTTMKWAGWTTSGYLIVGEKNKNRLIICSSQALTAAVLPKSKW